MYIVVTVVVIHSCATGGHGSLLRVVLLLHRCLCLTRYHWQWWPRGGGLWILCLPCGHYAPRWFIIHVIIKPAFRPKGLARLMFRIADTLEPKVGAWVGRTGWVLFPPRRTVFRHVELFSATWNWTIRSKWNPTREIRTQVISQNSAVAAIKLRAPDDEIGTCFTKNTFTNTIFWILQLSWKVCWEVKSGWVGVCNPQH